MNFRFLSVFLSLVFAFASTQAQQVDAGRVYKHIAYLASDKLEGREPGTKGEKLAQKYIIKQFKSLGLTPKGENGYLQPFTFKLSANPHEVPAASAQAKAGANVVAYLDNGAANTIVIGAHYDHLGKGYGHFSLDANGEGQIHNGADDNASGVAGVLELARYFSQNGVKEKCNFLFICFSAEEAGLIGSKYFTEHPTLDLTKVQCMFNMDMIGRLNEGKALFVSGTGTAPDFEPLIDKTSTSLVVKKDSSGIGPSDHTAFYLKNVPVLFFFTGVHSDYHKPSDDTEKINTQGEAEVIAYVATLAEKIADMPKLTFLQTRSKEKKGAAFKVTLGIMPDYSFDKGGVKADDIVEGKPGMKAGMKKGDIILQIGEYPTADIYAYMEALAKFKAGDTTTLKVKRGSEELTLKVTF